VPASSLPNNRLQREEIWGLALLSCVLQSVPIRKPESTQHHYLFFEIRNTLIKSYRLALWSFNAFETIGLAQSGVFLSSWRFRIAPRFMCNSSLGSGVFQAARSASTLLS
jgi:hypothetical protein